MPFQGDEEMNAANDQVQDRGFDWNGPNDRDNPRTWSLIRKIYHTFVPVAVAFEVCFATTAYAAGHKAVMQEFGISSTAALVPYSLLILGLAFGPVISGPCSETFGRKPVYLISVPVMALFILGAGFARSLAVLCLCRFLVGVAGSPGVTIVAASIADLWPVESRMGPLTIFTVVVYAGSALGSVIGPFAVTTHDWRWTQWISLFVMAILWPLGLFGQETCKYAILKRRRARQRIKPRDQGELVHRAKALLRATVTRPLNMLLVEPIVTFFSLYLAFDIALCYSFFSSYGYVFSTVYGLTPESQGLIFLGMAVGYVVGGITIALVDLWSRAKMRVKIQQGKESNGKQPEDGLYNAMMGSVALPASLFWFAWSARPSVHWISPVIASAVFGWADILIYTAAVQYITDTYGVAYSASAMAALALLRSSLGAAFPLFSLQMFQRLGIPWATSLLGFASLTLTPIPWVFYRYGPRLRSMTRYPS